MALIFITHRNDKSAEEEIGIYVDADLDLIAQLKLSADEIVTAGTEQFHPNMRWPTFGDEGEEYIFNFNNKEPVERYKEIYNA